MTLYPKPVEATDVTEDEINGQNTLLWEKELSLDEIAPINGPHYRILDSGGAEYTGWISAVKPSILAVSLRWSRVYRLDLRENT